jgi:mannose-6-phosphate isomerase-like protein (cupin superfamily)
MGSPALLYPATMHPIHKQLEAIKAFTAGDDTEIREVLHPENDGVDFGFSLAHATLQPGEASRPHVLHGRSETYIIEQGKGSAFIDGQSMEAKPGSVVFIPPGADQYIQNTGEVPLKFWCVVCPPWTAETEEVD